MRNLVFTVLMLLAFNSCTFFLNEPDDYEYIDSQIKMLGNFGIGSFWIYHNDSLNINDTISVIKYTPYYSSVSWDKHTRYSENIDIILKNSSNDIINDLISGNTYTRKVLDSNKKWKLIFDLSRNYYDYYLSETSVSTYLEEDRMNLVKDYTINTVKYDSLLCYTPVYSRNHYYFAFDVGIVKKAIRDSSKTKTNTWYLIKYQITK